jgi:hypothetical protein
VVGPPALGEDRWRHALLIDSGWREVAHTALGFIKRFVYPHDRRLARPQVTAAAPGEQIGGRAID